MSDAKITNHAPDQDVITIEVGPCRITVERLDDKVFVFVQKDESETLMQLGVEDPIGQT